VGRRTFPALEVPRDCTVARWKDLLSRGRLCSEVHGASRLICFTDGGSRTLGEDERLPLAPEEVHVEGPTSVLGALAIALKGGTANHLKPATPHKTTKSPRRMFFLSGLIGHNRRTHQTSDDATSNHDRASAEAILEFWFEELSMEDWFRLSHLIDDRIWQDFGPLHRRAAAGELAGWKARPETCLALVVMLDQFSRRLYRGTAAAYACDVLAREAASAALIRGDDHHHWKQGPRRCALYLPFVHVDDTAEKTRLFAALGSQEGSSTKSASEELQRLLGIAAGTLAAAPRDPAAGGADEDGVFAIDEETISASSGMLVNEGSVTLPQLCSAPQSAGRRRLSAFVFEADVGHFSDCSSSYADEDRSATTTLVTSDSGTSIVMPDPSFVASAAAAAATEWHPGTRRQSFAPRPSSPKPDERGPAVSKEIAGSYPAQAALELPKIPSLTLNHEFGRRFRAMKLDKKTQQAYDRDKLALNMTTKYQCLVCADRHDFRLQGCSHW